MMTKPAGVALQFMGAVLFIPALFAVLAARGEWGSAAVALFGALLVYWGGAPARRRPPTD